LSITDHIQKTGAQIKNGDEQAIKTLAAVFNLPDIHDAIDHMAMHTSRPNVGYLKKVLDGWFNERKIQKVYS
jgi:phage terminase large subunit-like protein